MGHLLKERSRLCDEKWVRFSRNKIVRFILAHPLVAEEIVTDRTRVFVTFHSIDEEFQLSDDLL